MGTDIVSMDVMERMAHAVAKSRLWGFETPEQALAMMAIAAAEGKHPATAIQEYHIIKGKPALKADAMLARFQAAGGSVEWGEYTDDSVKGRFSHPQGGHLVVHWDIERAKQAGLLRNDTWSKYPRQMLRSRCISEGVRAVFPGVATGVYTPEEVEDMTPQVLPTVEPIPPPDRMSADEAADHMIAIGQAADLDSLRLAYMHAYQKAKASGDTARLDMFALCKDHRKDALMAEVDEV